MAWGIVTSFSDEDLKPTHSYFSYLCWHSALEIMDTVFAFWFIIVTGNAFLSYIVKLKPIVLIVLVSTPVFRRLMKFGTAEKGYLNYWMA